MRRGLLWLGLVGCGSGPVEGETASGTVGTSSGSSTTSEVPTSGGATSSDTGESGGVGETGGSEGVESGESSEGGESTGEPVVSLRYDEVRQKSAHNSFQRDEAIIDMIAVHRVRSLEFDIHVGKSLEDEVAGDWFVYHTDVVDDDSQCRLLSQCLGIVDAAAVAIPEHEVITLWVDLKDGFGGGHQPADLDARLISGFGARLFTPGELVMGCPGAMTVQGAVTACGWPELELLRGRVLVALTGGGGELTAYVGGDAAVRAAFVAPALSEADIVGHQEAAFVNLEAGDVSVATAVREAGLVSRVWVLDDADAWDSAVAAGVHHLATNQVNAWQDPWSTTAGTGGWPFTCISGCEAPTVEMGQVLRIDVDSGDLWNASDDALFVHWPLDGAVAVTGMLGAVSSHVEPFIKGCIGGRAGEAADAAYLLVCRPADDEPLRVQVRAAAGEDSEEFAMDDVEGLATELPAYAKFERDVDGLCARGYGSVDGAQWVKIAEHCFEEPLTHVGVAASGHDAGATSVWMFGVTASPGGALLAADATTVALRGAVGAASDSF